jgi:hypothetical protein
LSYEPFRFAVPSQQPAAQLRSHLGAGIGALLANGHALVHFSDRFAIGRTSAAHFRAHSARQAVQIRAAQHEIGARLADLRAVQHQPEVLRFHMLASGFQAVVHRRFKADVVAFETVLDALFHFRIAAAVFHEDGRSVGLPLLNPSLAHAVWPCGEADISPESGIGGLRAARGQLAESTAAACESHRQPAV